MSDLARPQGIKMAQFIEALPGATVAVAAQYRRGALLVAGAALACSNAGLITRLTATDAWTTLFWRSLFSMVFLVLYIALRYRGGAVTGFRRLGKALLRVARARASTSGIATSGNFRCATMAEASFTASGPTAYRPPRR